MDLTEFDALLHDAEVKLKRLKALYEQWFQGIERTEPTVARKDLDRAFVLLNKDKPRNTAARFRLQQLVARYSIYQTYWGRIARQIEEGTYERDVRRAQRGRTGVEEKRAKAYELDLDEDIAIDDELFEDDEIASVIRALDEKPPAAPPAQKPALSVFSPFAMGAKRPPQGAPAAGSSNSGAAPSPIAPSAGTMPAAPSASTATAMRTGAAPLAPNATSAAARTPVAPSARTPPAPSAPLASKTSAAARTPAAPTSSTPLASNGPARPPSAAARPAAPSGPAAMPRPPAPSTTSAVASDAAKPAEPSTMKKPVTATFGKPQGSARTKPDAPPASPAVPRPTAQARPVPPPPPPTPDDPGLKRLYASYVEARRRNNERGDVAYDKVAQSIREMRSKLREKHGNRDIDFEVVVQNGKVGLKPRIG